MATSRGNEIVAELLANVRDMDIEQVRHAVIVLIEQVLVEIGPRNDAAAMDAQKFDQRIFARR